METQARWGLRESQDQPVSRDPKDQTEKEEPQVRMATMVRKDHVVPQEMPDPQERWDPMAHPDQ